MVNKKSGLKGASTDTADLNELTYLLESGSDRIGALGFQQSPTEDMPRNIQRSDCRNRAELGRCLRKS